MLTCLSPLEQIRKPVDYTQWFENLFGRFQGISTNTLCCFNSWARSLLKRNMIILISLVRTFWNIRFCAPQNRGKQQEVLLNLSQLWIERTLCSSFCSSQVKHPNNHSWSGLPFLGLVKWLQILWLQIWSLHQTVYTLNSSKQISKGFPDMLQWQCLVGMPACNDNPAHQGFPYMFNTISVFVATVTSTWFVMEDFIHLCNIPWNTGWFIGSF